MPTESDRRGLMHEIEHRRIKREVERALERTEHLRSEVRRIEEHYRTKPEAKEG